MASAIPIVQLLDYRAVNRARWSQLQQILVRQPSCKFPASPTSPTFLRNNRTAPSAIKRFPPANIRPRNARVLEKFGPLLHRLYRSENIISDMTEMYLEVLQIVE